MQNKEYFFNLIIPYHNPSEEMIKRLFDSLIKQGINKNELIIIAVDDNSDNLNYREWIKKYDLNIFFTETNTEIHCPGNTRRKGMEFINGQWLFFCDQDDFFEPNALSQIKNYINIHSNEKIYVISTIMRGYNLKLQQATSDYVHKQAWLHGKWFSIKNLIIPYHINFKENLTTHEDIYFNSLILSILFKIGTDWNYLDIYTYNWTDNPESITRKIVPSSERGYLFDNFEDYMISAGEPYWEEAIATHNPFFINQIMMTLLHAYFYYEAASYYEGPDNYTDIIEIIKNYIHRIVKELNVDLDYIVNFVYQDPYKYNAVKKDCDMFSGEFIPKTSFRDFIYKLGQ